jgi:hypothetical protein
VVVGGGAIVCLLAEGGPIVEGAMDVLFDAAAPPAAVPLILCLAALTGVPVPLAAFILLGRGFGVVAPTAAFPLPFVFGAGAGFGFGSSSTTIAGDGWMNKPWFGGHSKYLSPRTDPSFLPSGSSSSRPIHCPSLKETSPMKRTVPTRPSPIWTFCPTLNDIVTACASFLVYL